MPFSPISPDGASPSRVYLFNCPYEEKEDAKRAGAKWDAKAGSWYVSGEKSLEPFNRWHPNERKYLVCSYSEKEDAKKAGARWDASCKQWYFDANDSKAESRLERWLPSSKQDASSKNKPKKNSSKTSSKKTTTKIKTSPQTGKSKALSKSQLATIPRINNDMTVSQLHTECRARDPSVKGLSSKNKDWLLKHLKIGSPWISHNTSGNEEVSKRDDVPPAKTNNTVKKPPLLAAATKNSTKKAPTQNHSPLVHAEMTVAQLQMECRARDPNITGLSNKTKTWLLDHLKIGTPRAPAIHADMTVAQLQMECRARDLNIKGLSNKNKTWLLDHLKIGTPRAPVIHADMTLAQLQMECQVRNPDIKGLSNKKKRWFLDHLKVGTTWISSSMSAEACKSEKSKKSKVPSLVQTSASVLKNASNITNNVEQSSSQKAVYPRIHAEMTVAQLQIECRVRDPFIKGLSNKNKSWFLDHLKIGTKWISADISLDDQSNENEDPKTVKKSIIAAKKTFEPTKTPQRMEKPPTATELSDSSRNNCLAAGTKKIESNSSSKQTKKIAKKVKLEPSSTQYAPKRPIESIKKGIKHDPDASHASKLQSEPRIKKRKIAPTNEYSRVSVSTQTETPKLSVSCSLDSGVATAGYPSTQSALSSYSRITSKMTIATLKVEATARKLSIVPKLKSELLNCLVEGSICVHEAPEYKAYQDLLKRVQGEDSALRSVAAKKNQEIEERREKLRAERLAKEEKKRAEEEKRREEERRAEIKKQNALHVHSFPRVHRCPLANTDNLMFYGKPRCNSQCDLCGSKWGVSMYGNTYAPKYTCESCDWDVCQKCFDDENQSEAVKEKIRKKREQERQEKWRKRIEAEEKEEEERRKRWDAEVRFPSKIRELKGKHIHPDSTGFNFTVWCSDGYDNDGWHSYEGEPTKEFDSVWKTKEEANKRAEYLFYWKNVWGLDPEEVDNQEVELRDVGDLKGWSVCPDDSSRWTVGVVPSDAFLYLSNASKCRHNYDDSDATNDHHFPFRYHSSSLASFF